MKAITVGFLCIGLVRVSGAWAGGEPTAEAPVPSREVGHLAFDPVPDALHYRVEWASTPDGPWERFDGEATQQLNRIPPPEYPETVTVRVPLFFRVVATAPRDDLPRESLYMDVDLSAGPAAESYPVRYHAAPPPGGWPDEFKTERLLFRRIPAGTFTPHTLPLDGLWEGGPGPEITLTEDFYVGVFPVTQKQWHAVMGTWPSYFNHAAYRDMRPVERVSYRMIRGGRDGAGWPAQDQVDANSFLGRLRARTGKAFDLPTEAQWERVHCAGAPPAEDAAEDAAATGVPHSGRAGVGRYWYADAATYRQSSGPDEGTVPVGTYPPNAWGVCGFYGSVREWCRDWRGEQRPRGADPTGPMSGTQRVVRDGVSPCAPPQLRAWPAQRLPDLPSNAVGFRLVCPAPREDE